MLCDVKCLPSVMHNPAVSIVGENQVEFAFSGYRIPVDDICGLTSRNVPLLTAAPGHSPALKRLDVNMVAIARHGADIGNFNVRVSNVTQGNNATTATDSIAVVSGSARSGSSQNFSETLIGFEDKTPAKAFTQLVLEVFSPFNDEGWIQLDGTVTILLE